jgi:hypothetical protein
MQTCPSNPLAKKPGEGHADLIFPDLSEVISAAHGIYSFYHDAVSKLKEIHISVPVTSLLTPLVFSLGYDDEFSHRDKTYLSITITISDRIFKKTYTGVQGTCWRIKWYPDLCLVAADGLLFGKRDRTRVRIEPTVCFSGDDISGRWLMAIRDHICRLLGARAIIMGDESVIYYKGDDYFDMRPFYVQKHGQTYYMQYGYIPLQADSMEDVIGELIDGKPLTMADTSALFSRVKSKPPLVSGNQREWQESMQEFTNEFPHVYIKFYGDGEPDLARCKGTYVKRPMPADAQAGSSARAQAGSSARAQAGSSARAQAGSSARAQAGSSARAQAGSQLIQKLYGNTVSDEVIRQLMTQAKIMLPLTASTRSTIIKTLKKRFTMQ